MPSTQSLTPTPCSMPHRPSWILSSFPRWARLDATARPSTSYLRFICRTHKQDAHEGLSSSFFLFFSSGVMRQVVRPHPTSRLTFSDQWNSTYTSGFGTSRGISPATFCSGGTSWRRTLTRTPPPQPR